MDLSETIKPTTATTASKTSKTLKLMPMVPESETKSLEVSSPFIGVTTRSSKKDK